MNKEEAKKRISQALKVKAREDTHIIGLPYISWGETADKIDAIIDGLTIDHPKVKLPREVGEEFDKTVSYLKTEETDIDAFDYVAGILYDGDERENHPNLSDWYNRTANAALILADAYRYGWEAEPEELFYVQAPDNWDHRWAWKSDGPSFQGCVCWKVESELHKVRYEQFTRAELKKYHLDSDIFTLVAVEGNHGEE